MIVSQSSHAGKGDAPLAHPDLSETIRSRIRLQGLSLLCFALVLLVGPAAAAATDCKPGEIWVVPAEAQAEISRWLEVSALPAPFSARCEAERMELGPETIQVWISCDGGPWGVLKIVHAGAGTAGRAAGENVFSFEADRDPPGLTADDFLGAIMAKAVGPFWIKAKSECLAAPAENLADAVPPAPSASSVKERPSESDEGVGWRGIVWKTALALILALALWGALGFLRSRWAEIRRKLPATLWRHSAGATVAFLALLILLQAWSIHSVDADFFLPNVFSALILASASLFLLSGFIGNRVVRLNVLACLILIPNAVVMIGEYYFRERESADSAPNGEQGRLQISDDLLLRYHYRPGAVVNKVLASGETEPPLVNELGLNDASHGVAKPPDVFRIVLLGDSVPNDSQFPYSALFPARLEKRLNARLTEKGAEAPYRRADVINVSCEGYNTLQEVRLFEKAGRAYRPDLVIVAYTLNDPFLQNGAFRRIGNSYFAFQAFHVFMHLEALLFGATTDLGFGELHEGYTYELIVRHQFERLKLLSEEDRFKTLVAVLPVFFDFRNHPFVPIYEKVAATAREQGFEALILFDAFKEEPLERYKKGMELIHPTAPGHELIAEKLAEYVIGKGLL